MSKERDARYLYEQVALREGYWWSDWAYEYTRLSRRRPGGFRWPEYEEYLLANWRDIPNATHWIYRYAKDFVGGRWREAEPIILQDPKYIYFYAKDIIIKPWPEGEAAYIEGEGADWVKWFDHYRYGLSHSWRQPW